MKRNLILICVTTFIVSACQSEIEAELEKHGVSYDGVPEKPLAYIKSLPLEQQAKVLKLRKRVLQNLVFVEGGGFVMGDIIEEVPEGTEGAVKVNLKEVEGKWFLDKNGYDEYFYWPHWVELDSYSIAKYETTYGEADIFTEVTGREYFDKKRIEMNSIDRLPEKPVWFGASWYDARAYCQWLGKITGEPFDLLSEAQWEYAARSRGKALEFATDNGEIDYGRNVKDHVFDGTKPPGSFPPNPLGVYDMSGNVREWVLDSYSSGFYEVSPIKNPIYDLESERRYKLSRGGGGLGDHEKWLDVFGRSRAKPDSTSAGHGVRCGVDSSEPVVVSN
jgi:formylglycine-generating enzyme required for sulfatase activity